MLRRALNVAEQLRPGAPPPGDGGVTRAIISRLITEPWSVGKYFEFVTPPLSRFEPWSLSELCVNDGTERRCLQSVSVMDKVARMWTKWLRCGPSGSDVDTVVRLDSHRAGIPPRSPVITNISLLVYTQLYMKMKYN